MFPEEQRAACYTAGLNEQDIIRLRTTTNELIAPPICDHWVIAPEHMTPDDVITLPIGAGAQVQFRHAGPVQAMSQPMRY